MKKHKPFDLAAAKAGKPVMFTDGCRDIKFLTTLNDKILFKGINQGGAEYVLYTDHLGDSPPRTPLIVMAPEIREYWMGVWKTEHSVFTYSMGGTLHSKIEAEEATRKYTETYFNRGNICEVLPAVLYHTEEI
jgi:hypothetical protein